MANIYKNKFLEELKSRFGKLEKLSDSLSLFDLYNGAIRIYVRYSKLHPGNKTFYGLRKEDLKLLEGKNSFICFLWDNQKEPLLIPYSDFEEFFSSIEPAKDGQYKAQIYFNSNGTEFYIANSGRYNVEGYFGWNSLLNLIDSSKTEELPELTHSNVQSLLGGIGAHKGLDIWIPQIDRTRLDSKLATKFSFRNYLPEDLGKIKFIIQEVDVIWFEKGSSIPNALFEVEHSTPIYSGLLRFNDILLITPSIKSNFSIVSNELRRSLFTRQINRPTFQASGLINHCSFLEYKDVFNWFNRISKEKS